MGRIWAAYGLHRWLGFAPLIWDGSTNGVGSEQETVLIPDPARPVPSRPSAVPPRPEPSWPTARGRPPEAVRRPAPSSPYRPSARSNKIGKITPFLPTVKTHAYGENLCISTLAWQWAVSKPNMNMGHMCAVYEPHVGRALWAVGRIWVVCGTRVARI